MSPEPRIITLTTDFGHSDEYVGVLKGVILSNAPHATIVDLCHDVPAQNIRHAALLLAASYRYFPPTALHLAVVDPGVGSDRRLVLLVTEHGLFLAPDNGLLTLILEEAITKAVYAITNENLFLRPPSPTFHGRDILAPEAAHLAMGNPPSSVGPEAAPSTLRLTPFPSAQLDVTAQAIHGEVLLIDHFGNLLTNITLKQISAMGGSADRIMATVEGKVIGPLRHTYAETVPGSLLALIGSRNRLEIAANQGNAALLLGSGVGARVVLSCH